MESPAGNVLWDCISLIDSATVAAVQDRGGLSAIAISHPHYYASMVEWSRAFGGVPIYLHAADRQWVMHHDPAIVFWSGETHTLGRGLTLVRCGGHFEGGTVLHWAARRRRTRRAAHRRYHRRWPATAAGSASCTATRTSSRSAREAVRHIVAGGRAVRLRADLRRLVRSAT